MHVKLLLQTCAFLRSTDVPPVNRRKHRASRSAPHAARQFLQYKQKVPVLHSCALNRSAHHFQRALMNARQLQVWNRVSRAGRLEPPQASKCCSFDVAEQVCVVNRVAWRMRHGDVSVERTQVQGCCRCIVHVVGQARLRHGRRWRTQLAYLSGFPSKRLHESRFASDASFT